MYGKKAFPSLENSQLMSDLDSMKERNGKSVRGLRQKEWEKKRGRPLLMALQGVGGGFIILYWTHLGKKAKT